jgi:hypothetical protein
MKQPWIHSARLDLGFILGPALFVTALVWLLQDRISQIHNVPPGLWLLLIVGIDVAHVWSTAFRTYFDRAELRARQALYVLAPLAGFVGGVLLYRIDGMLFWRVLAYLAVFHFVRQQYGFVMLYRRAESADPLWAKRLDQSLIYGATLYPLVAWHCQPRQFDWFVAGDFFSFDAPAFSAAAGWIYLALIALYLVKEGVFGIRRGWLNLPKNLMMLGTALSWQVGIVVFDNDLAFTATNVIAHGIPYLALIWVYGRNQQRSDHKQSFGFLFRKRFVLVFLGVLFLAAYFEEWLWDGLVWRDHPTLFPPLVPQFGTDDHAILSWLVPLLALPQITHYLLDAYIWRMNVALTPWKTILFLNTAKT